MAASGKSRVIYGIAVVLCLLALILAIVGFATPNWYTTRLGDTSVSLGLWRSMVKVGNSISLTQELSVNGEFNSYFEATRALSSVGTIFLVISFIASFLYFCLKAKRVVSAIVAGLLMLGALLLIVAVSMFAGFIHLNHDSTLLQTNENASFLDYSFYLQTAAAGVAILASVAFCVAAAVSHTPQNNW